MNTGISFFNSVNSAVCRPLLDWQLLTPETTFGLLVDKVGGMTFWKQISQAFLTLSLSLFSTFRFFTLSSFAPHSTIRTPGTGYVSFPWTRHVSASEGERSRFRFPGLFLLSHFRSSLFPLRFQFFFSFLNPCPRSHDRDRFFRNFAFAKYQGEYNSKFYLILRSGCFVNGCVFTRVYVICKICEKLRRIHSCWCLLDLSEIRDKKEWVLVRREVLVSGLFFRSRSLETFYLASILKIIATCDQATFFFLF